MAKLTVTKTEINSGVAYAEDLRGRKTAAELETSADYTEALSATPAELDASQAYTEALTVTAIENNNSVKYTNLAPTAAGKVTTKLTDNKEDVTILVLSDSTGDETDELTFKLAEFYASEYPAYSVQVYRWVEGIEDYTTPDSISTGTGSNTLSFYNMARSGSRPDYALAKYFDVAIRDIPQADLIIMNHGHNIDGTSANFDDNPSEYGIAPMLIVCASTVIDVHDGAGLLFSSQNPKRPAEKDVQNKDTYNAIVSAASFLNADVTDSYLVFEAAGRPNDWYDDDTHPSEQGFDEAIIPATIPLLRSKSHKAARSLFSESRDNLLVNGDFSALTVGEPDDWTIGSNATIVQDTTNYESTNGYSIQLTQKSPGTGSANMNQKIDGELLDSLKGKWVTVLARVFAPDGSPDTTGQVRLTSGAERSQTRDEAATGGFIWKCASIKVPADATDVRVWLYGDWVGSSTGEASFDRVALFKGKMHGYIGV